jgi:tRNA A-37 threonylcarbamoyl transferase component Bud32/tetratricopeptide (TPR) repeat protein
MADSSTNGKGRDKGNDAGNRTTSTHESGPGDDQVADDDLDILARGATVGRYLVLERLGAGAMGVVYAAYDPELDRRVAIKLLRPQQGRGDPAARQARLVREAKAMAKLSHPNVGAIFDVGVHQGQVFLAMEYLPGGTLRQWLETRKRPWREVVRIFADVGHGLSAAHAEGLIHRDFKPDNVLLDKSGKPKVVDFGLVRLAGPVDISASNESIDQTELALADTAMPESTSASGDVLTRTGTLAGTPAYMAPEQFMARAIDARTDQFAFCVALYEALYGERPFSGDNLVALADAVTTGRLQPAPRSTQVPGWLRACVIKGLRTDPAERYPGFDQLLARLARDPARRTRTLAITGVGVLAVVTAVATTSRLSSQRRTMCKAGTEHFAGIWEPGPGGAERKAAIQRAFAASGKSYADKAFGSVSRLFDQWVARWTGMYTETCEATHVRGEQSAEVLDLRMTCLQERIGNARALSDVFAVADGKVVENAVSAAAALPSLDRCADVPALRAVVKPPEDAATRKRVDDLRAQLATLIALRDSGQCTRALPRADTLIAQARAVGYQPLLADTLYESAQLGNYCSDGAIMLQRYKEAYATANASRKDDIAAQAAAIIPTFAVNRLRQLVVAQEWFGVAQGAVARLGRETMASAMLALSESFVSAAEHDYPRAIDAADRSIDITRRLLGPDDPLTIGWQANKGDLQAAAGRLDEALQTDISAREHFDRVLGLDHPRAALVWNNQGEVLNLLGRHAEAEAAYQHALRIFRQSGTNADVLGWALTGLGRARLGEKRPAAAVAPLEEALADRIESHSSRALLGETRFALARALWSRPGERRRALSLAASAREESSDDPKAVAEIDSWLAGSTSVNERKRNP